MVRGKIHRKGKMSFSKGNITIKFNDIFRDDKDTEFNVFDKNFNTKYAKFIIDEISGKAVTGRLRGRASIKFQYSGEEEIEIRAVAMGLTGAQYCVIYATIDKKNHTIHVNGKKEVMYGVVDQTIIEKMKEFFSNDEG